MFNCNWVYIFFLAIAFDYRFERIFPGAPSFTLLEFFSYVFLLLLMTDVKFLVRYFSFFVGAAPVHALFFLWCFFAAIICFFFDNSLNLLSDYKNIIPSIVVMSCIIYFFDKLIAKKILFFMFIGYFLNAIIGVMQGHLDYPRPVSLSEASYYKMSMDGAGFSSNFASGFFNHPNSFSVFMLPSVVISLHCSFESKSKTNKIIFFFAILVCFYCLYLTQGKGAMIWAAYSLFLYLIFVYNINRSFYFSFAMTLAAVFFVIGYAIWDSDVNVVSSTMNTRIILWEAALQAFNEYPSIILYGNSFDAMIGLSWDYTGGQLFYANSHNGWINVALNWGLIGFVLYVVSYFYTAYCLFLVKKYDDLFLVSRAIVAVMFGMMAEYFYEPTTEGVALQAQMFAIMGLGIGVNLVSRSTYSPPPP